MNERFLAVCLWVFAWILVDVTALAAFWALGGRKRLVAAIVAAGGFAIAALANAGADLW